MTSASASLSTQAPTTLARWLAPAGLLLGLAVIVGARWWATIAGADALWIGTMFGLSLAALVLIARSATSAAAFRPLAVAKAIAIGAAFGLALVGIVVVGSAISGTSVPAGMGRPAAPFFPWAAITILVAGAEEALLRGRLFDATRRAGGVVTAVLLTTVAFALMHVPLYGWHVVPLDLAVGLGLAGLRLATGGVLAPAVSHAVADLATWWL